MYNSVTEEKIKQIPQIADIDVDRLPQELTRIYAKIVSLRRKIADGTIDFDASDLRPTIGTLYMLSNNLETILLTSPNHERKESIAFVAGTAHSLIHKLGLTAADEFSEIFEVDTISASISAIILFLIGNSQADAAEISKHLQFSAGLSNARRKLGRYVQYLAKGDLRQILDDEFLEDDISEGDLQETAMDYLWQETGKGIFNIALKLTGSATRDLEYNHFDKVIELCVSEGSVFEQKLVFTGPYHLARLMRLLEVDILDRGVINTAPPKGIRPSQWESFLKRLADDRPYLWENHKEAVDTNFLDPGTSAVLTLPTGSGKSTLSELKIASCIFSDKKVVYLVPTHALKDQVKTKLKKLFEGYQPEMSEFDAEYTEFGDIDSVPILVMTPERCQTLINMTPDIFQSVGLVVFDEFHLIHGTSIRKDRRAIDAMCCLISLFTEIPHADYLLISAMVENGEDISEWIQKITGRECILFNSSWKPTRQLHGCLIFEKSKVSSLETRIRKVKENGATKNPPVALKRALTIDPICIVSLKNIWETNEDIDYFQIPISEGTVLLEINNQWGLTTNRNDIAARLAIHFSKLGIKTLVFVDSPRTASSTSKKIIEGTAGQTNTYDDYISKNVDGIRSLSAEFGGIEYSYLHDHRNVGVHHGLLLPLERSLIEGYFKQSSGSVAMVATATLAQGINLPAEIVIIAGDDRYSEDSGYRERVSPHELLNAAGRAGRAGQSSQGAVILIPGEIVTIEGSTISDRWWKLKNDVFSKSDQCLIVEDPLQYFLDSIGEASQDLNNDQINILYKFKSENLSETETKKLLSKSFYAYCSAKNNTHEEFVGQVESLLKRRNILDEMCEQIPWTREISYKTGIDPSTILTIGNAIERENFAEFAEFSIIELIEWFFTWLENNSSEITKIFTKRSTIDQIIKATGINPMVGEIDKIKEQITSLAKLLINYVSGVPLNEINNSIPGKDDPHLSKARNFVIRLVPEISFGFGLLSLIIIENAKRKGIGKLPPAILWLASCVREGFDDPQKLSYKHNKHLITRVETHLKFGRWS